MNAKELRIGNLLMVNGDIVVVSKIFSTHFYAISLSNKVGYDHSLSINYQPIPLTEEWLVRFGFVLQKGFWTNGILEFGYITTDENFQFEFKFPHTHWHRNNVLYVHQLQNLFFELTGEELTINE